MKFQKKNYDFEKKIERRRQESRKQNFILPPKYF